MRHNRAHVVKITGIDENRSEKLLNRIVVAATNDSDLLQKLHLIGKLELSSEKERVRLLQSGSNAKRLLEAGKTPTSKRIEALSSAMHDACLQVTRAIIHQGDEPADDPCKSETRVRLWLEYSIENIIKLLPSPPQKRWWHFFSRYSRRTRSLQVTADIAKSDKKLDVEKAALERLTDPSFIGDVAKNAVDSNVRQDSRAPEPVPDLNEPFLMGIEDVFSIKGRDTVAVGRILRGVIRVSEEVEIVGFRETRRSVVTGIEVFGKLVNQGQEGDTVGCMLCGFDKDEIERGQVLAKPGSIAPHIRFIGEVSLLKEEDGGRRTPLFTNDRLQFYFRTREVTGTVNLPEGVKMVMPGDNITMTIEIIAPVALEEQTRFAIREDGRTFGAGVVTKILTDAAGSSPSPQVDLVQQAAPVKTSLTGKILIIQLSIPDGQSINNALPDLGRSVLAMQSGMGHGSDILLKSLLSKAPPRAVVIVDNAQPIMEAEDTLLILLTKLTSMSDRDERAIHTVLQGAAWKPQKGDSFFDALTRQPVDCWGRSKAIMDEWRQLLSHTKYR
jgi:hypothetical protein